MFHGASTDLDSLVTRLLENDCPNTSGKFPMPAVILRHGNPKMKQLPPS